MSATARTRALTHAGGLVTRRTGGTTTVLLVRARPVPHDWVLPKGHIEDGETPEETAVREVAEEAGVEATPVRFLGELEFESPRSGRCRVGYFLMQFVRNIPRTDPREIRWCAIDEALELIRFDDTRALIRAATHQKTLMATKREATVDDLYHAPGKAELVNGELVLMPLTGHAHGRAVLRIAVSLFEYERRTKRGEAFGDNVGFLVRLPNRRSFSPDAAFYTGPPFGPKFIEGAPVFAVEVRSEEDYGPTAERAMAAKRADYFAAGTLVVWDVDLLRERWIRVYRATDPENPTIYRRGDIAEAEPAVPEWTFPVDDLFLAE